MYCHCEKPSYKHRLIHNDQILPTETAREPPCVKTPQAKYFLFGNFSLLFSHCPPTACLLLTKVDSVMQLQRSADKLWYRIALYMAFIAMYLLLAGPLISQYQGGGHHHTASKISHHHQTSHTEGMEPVFHWFHQCGYCAVWQQFPTAHAFLPAISLQAFITHDHLLTQSTQVMKSCDNYPHALTRAPPFFDVYSSTPSALSA